MNRPLRTIASMLFSLAICGTSIPCSFGQQSLAAKPRVSIIKYNGDLATMLFQVSEAYDTTIGFEADIQQPRSRVELDLRNPGLDDVLNAMVRSVPRYKWREHEGFIEFSPLEGNCLLLEIVINNFSVVDMNEQEAITQLFKLPEVDGGARAMRLRRQVPVVPASRTRGENFTLSLQNVTLRQVLSQIAKKSGKRIWIFRRDRDGAFSIDTAL